MTENLFTTHRYAECREYAGSLAEHDAVGVGALIVLRGYEIAALLALSETSAIPDKLTSLISVVMEQPEQLTTGWTFEGTLHFVRQAEIPDSHRDALILLFEALQAADRDAIIAGLRQFEASLATSPEPDRPWGPIHQLPSAPPSCEEMGAKRRS